MNSFIKDLFAVLKSRVLVIGSGILTSIITARYLGPSGNGIVATLTVYPDLFMVIGSLGIRQAAAYYIGQKKNSDNSIYSAILSIWIITTLICIITCYFLLKYLTQTEFSEELILLALLPIPFSLFNTYASGFFLGKNKIQEFNTVNWVPNVVKLISYIFLIVLLPLNIYGALIGIILGYVLLTFFVYNKINKLVELKWHLELDLIKGMLKLGLIYALSLLVISLNYKINVVLLEKLSNKDEVGIYTKGVSIVEYLWEVPTLLSTIIFARSISTDNSNDFSKKVCKLLRICFIIISILSIIFYFLSEIVMVVMYGEGFIKSSDVQKILLPGILLMTVFKVLNMDLAGRGKPWIAVIAIAPALVINAILNWKLDGKYGANGSAFSSTISYSIGAIVFIGVYSKFTGIKIKEIIAFRKSDFDFVQPMIVKFKNKIL